MGFLRTFLQTVVVKLPQAPGGSAAADQSADAPLPADRNLDSATSRAGKVMELQQSLKAAGCDPGRIDGKMGDKTKTAIRKFQKAKGLRADGVAGPKTQAALGVVTSASASSASKSASTAALQSIWIEPGGPTMVSGKQRQFVAKGDYDDGEQKDLTSALKWTSTAPKIFSVDAKGLGVAGTEHGTASITATDRDSGVRTTIKVKVVPPGSPLLESITISPRIKSIKVGEQQQFTCTGKWSDGHTEDLTNVVDWNTGWPEGMSIDRGLAVAGPKGPESESEPEPMWIGAIDLDNDVKDIIDFVMTKGPNQPSELEWDFESIVVDPQSPTIAPGEKRQIKATGSFDDGTSREVTRFVMWSSSAPSIASIDRLGIVTAQGESGRATIKATDWSTGVVGEAELTLQPLATDGIDHEKPLTDDELAQKKQKVKDLMTKRAGLDTDGIDEMKSSVLASKQKNSPDPAIDKKKQQVKDWVTLREELD